MKLVVLYILAMPCRRRGLRRRRRCCSTRPGRTLQPRRPRPDRDALRLRLGVQQQRLGVRRPGTVTSQWYTTTLGLCMLIGRFFLIIPALAIGGSLVRKQKVPATAGTFPTDTPLFGGLVARRHPHRRRPDVLPRPGARPHRRAPVALGARDDDHAPRTRHRPTCPAAPPKARRRPSGRSQAVRPGHHPPGASMDSFVKLNPAHDGPQPGDVRGRGRLGADHDPLLPRPRHRRRPTRTSSPGWSSLCLWFTVLFANFAEAMAEGRGKAQAATLRKTRAETDRPGAPPDGVDRRGAVVAARSRRPVRRHRRRGDPRRRRRRRGHRHGRRVGDHRRVGAGDPRESGGDRSAVTGGTRVLSDEIVVRITAKPGETFLDRMIALVEGANRQKTPERDRPDDPAGRAHDHLPAGGRDAAAVRHLLGRRADDHRARRPARVPDPDHDRRRCCRPSASPAWTASCSATCWRCAAGRSRPPATSTRCCSTRPAPSPSAPARRPSSSRCTGVDDARAGRGGACCRASPTRRRRAARSSTFADRAATGSSSRRHPSAVLVPFTAQTRMSGMDFADGRSVRKGAADAVRRLVDRGGRRRCRSSSARSSTASPATAPRRSS